MSDTRFNAPNIVNTLFIFACISLTILLPAFPYWRSSITVLNLLQGTETLMALLRKTFFVAYQSFIAGLRLIAPFSIFSVAAGIISLILSAIVAAVYPWIEEHRDISHVTSETIGLIVSIIVAVIMQNYLFKKHGERFLLWRFGIPLVITIITLSLTLCLLELVLKFLRGLFWRIAEYQKGPVTAITAILTTILAMVKYFLSI
jgi:uncharacterized protein YacL